MSVFHFFEILQMVLNRAKDLILNVCAILRNSSLTLLTTKHFIKPFPIIDFHHYLLNIYLFKVNKGTLEKRVTYVQS